VNNPFERAEGMVADRIVRFLRLRLQFARIGDELPRNRIVRVAWVDQASDGRRDGDCVARRHFLQRRQPAGSNEPRIGQFGRAAQRFLRSNHGGLASMNHGPYA
jgi:hypothetical protein